MIGPGVWHRDHVDPTLDRLPARWGRAGCTSDAPPSYTIAVDDSVCLGMHRFPVRPVKDRRLVALGR
jgi:hypothetical protein